MRIVFITGGVISSLGKGVISASIASVLEEIGFKVTILKLDPYLNVDAGTMNPFEHGEVFVTFDGGETDLDIGHYERFTNILFSKRNNVTSGQIYLSVLEKERTGQFLGQTIQVIPHVTNEIKNQIYSKVSDFDIGIVEIGGTVGDIESLPFLEAARQMKIENPRTIFLHLTYLPYISNTGEFKTKPTQHSVKELRQIGIQPDFIILRTDKRKISSIIEIRKKIALFCNLKEKNIIPIPSFDFIYQIPYYLIKNNFHKLLMKKLNLISSKFSLDLGNTRWRKINEILVNFKRMRAVNVGIVGKYTRLRDSYKSLYDSLLHSAISNNLQLKVKWIDAEKLEKNEDFSIFDNIDKIIIPGGFGKRAVEGKIKTIKWARENDIPLLGICLGLQLIFIEFFRNVLRIPQANSTEFDPDTAFPVVDLLENQRDLTKLGGTMRLGNYKCLITPNTLAHKIYGKEEIYERHRHRYEINLRFLKEYQKDLKDNGMVISGINPETNLVEIIELKNKRFFLGVQFHPEFSSRVFSPHPIFSAFLKNEN